MDNRIKDWSISSHLSRGNQSWIEQLYKDFLINPDLVDISWHSIFKQLLETTEIKTGQSLFLKKNPCSYFTKHNFKYFTRAPGFDINKKQTQVLQLINAYRFYGHQHANLDPLKLWKKSHVPDLNPKHYHLIKSDLKKKLNVHSFGFCKNKKMTLKNFIKILKQTYCGTIGAEYMHITSTDQKSWIKQRIESVAGNFTFSDNEKKRFLLELISAEELEYYLAAKFPSTKRFSLEGSEVLVLMLKELIRYAGNNGTREVVLGMTHRGRLNVLINVLGKKPKELFDDFLNRNDTFFGTGDVIHHMGFSSSIKTEGGIVQIMLVFNPSHLEIVNPVVIGTVRARLDRLNEQNSNKVLAITIHGDAAIIGQGVVQETLNMSKVRGYEVGGTIRIIINNQIGFTTSNLLDSRSSLYCTDIGKMVEAPIFHVNADDPEAVVFVTRLALDYRKFFKRDVFIDLFCYRRHGHNEADDPNVTQPLMYQKIKKHPSICKIYSDKLKAQKIMTIKDITEITDFYRSALDTGKCVVKELYKIPIDSFAEKSWHDLTRNNNCLNKIAIKSLKKLAKCISTVPDNITMRSSVAKIYADRQSMAECDKKFDWGGAEMLAYATLVNAGISVRISGEDVSRGAFFHRHAVIHDQSTGCVYIPLQHLHNKQGLFQIWDSVLSEEAVLAFEYGYATAEPKTLTIWEAQFGDFANGAQVVIDQFISSGEKKWGRMCGLVMLLPHGYEGQGPEHSSARLERYLQLCAEKNMRICVPSTPSQIYHILRRQAFCYLRRPLIIISPKSLLRHKLAVSSLNELANGTFLPVVGEINNLDPQIIKRVVFCSGKVFYDLISKRYKTKQNDVAILRIEQLYPFPRQEIKDALKPYSHVQSFVWCQEEPLNQGAWYFSKHYFREIIPSGSVLFYAGRPASASPAVGCILTHQKQQQNLLNDALNADLSKDTQCLA